MPKTLYNYQEFIRLSHEGKIAYEKVEVPKNASLLTDKDDVDNYIYLIVDGYVALLLNDGKEHSKIYSIQGKGTFLNYFTLLDQSNNRFNFKTLAKCSLYKYSKADMSYFLSMFPENFGFQFFIMKNQTTHVYFKSLMASSPASEKLKITFSNMGLLHGFPQEDGTVVLPQAIKTSHLLSYSNLSKSCFYKDLQHLKLTNQIEKKDKNWVIRSKELYTLLLQSI
ncbi:Crp/Fnr family transcriptional regulator [Listeria marthii]|uniref:Crp/Fnr family transcriptional regulator n=1 Tax=Listeria TaxID=1637 RepID=UPI00162870F5|nr:MULTISPECIES: Crp/Fnr family transcriptional regulator [Listeria]MBC1969642.1 Crp/Fnr family transcriptional regulator [Listeria marthii]MBC1998301.1 Crp/Fnr family transcriptional regulator [Listeria marthii]MBC2000923.1 Crp/Fnr family transcriptional regulator [Listeria marthii]MBC2012225.1 Crp/Fnr family transcriptional regulator [Listeria marthii]MBC2073755.1 Crp/Fnr family transcriptional regulator [Listeria marthii]